ncbi:MAG: endonuclease/exonuclease/phosphatase family protein [Bacteroidales bacterium]|nr:endonuclease/exonuclease/phosphatase family protein [Bacteroidales bacterium]
MKKTVFGVLLLALLPAFVSCKQEAAPLKVMSFNVRNSSANDGENCWENRRSAAVEMINAVRPDIIGLQEALPDQEEFLIKECPMFSPFGVGRNDGVDGERMSVLYNRDVLEFLDGGTWWLSETPDVPSVGWDAKYPRTATWVLMKDRRSGKQFYLVNTHLDHKGVQARRNGLAMVMDKIHGMNPSIPLVLMGDFNVEPGDECLTDVERLMKNARTIAKVTEDTPSFNGYNPEPVKIIDYIYFNGFSGADDFHVITRQFAGRPFISDHYPIVSTLRY